MNPNFRRNSSTPNESTAQHHLHQPQQQQLFQQQPLHFQVQGSLDAGCSNIQPTWKKPSPEMGCFENQSPVTPISFMGRKIAGTSNMVLLKSQKTTTTSSSQNSGSKKFPAPLSQKNSKQRSRADSFQRGSATGAASFLTPLILEEEFMFGDGSIQENTKVPAIYSTTNGSIDGNSFNRINNQQLIVKNAHPLIDNLLVQSTKSCSKGSQKQTSSRFPNTTKSQNSNGIQIDAFFKNEYPTSKRLNANQLNGSKPQSKVQRSLERQSFSNTAVITPASQNLPDQQNRKTISKQSNNIKSSGTFVATKKKPKKKTIQSLKGLSQAQTTSQDMNSISQHINDAQAVARSVQSSQVPPSPSPFQSSQTRRQRQSGSFQQSDSTMTVKHIEKTVFDIQQNQFLSRNNNHVNKEQLEILSQQQQPISQNQGSTNINDQSQTLYTANTATFEASGTIDADEFRMDIFKKPKSVQEEKRNRSNKHKKLKVRLANGSRSKSNGKKSSLNSTTSSHNQTFQKTKLFENSRNSNNTLEFSQQYGNGSSHLKSSLNSSSIPNGRKPERSSSEGKRSGNFNQISIDNLKKKRLQELVSRQVEIQNDKDRMEKKLKQQIENEQIRIQNAQRFLKQRMREPAVFPWGFNQQKIRLSLENQMRREERSQERQVQQQYNQQLNDENFRRERLGLSFMNNLDENTILNLKRSSQPSNQTGLFSAYTFVETPSNAQQNHQIHINSNNTSAKAKATHEQQQYLQAFIEIKKQIVEEQEREQLIIKQNEKQRIEDNLKRLNETIKRQQRQCRSKSFTKKRNCAGGSLHLSQQQYLQDSQLGHFVIPQGPQTLQPIATNQPVITRKLRSASNGEYRVADAELISRKLSEIAFNNKNGGMDQFEIQGPEDQNDDQQSSQATEGNFTDRKFSVLNSEFKNMIIQALYDQEQKKQQDFSVTAGAYGIQNYGVGVVGKSPMEKINNQSMIRPSSKEQSAQKSNLGGTEEIFSATGSSSNAFNSTNQSLQLKKQRIYQKFMQLENKFHSLYNENIHQNDYKSPTAAMQFNDSIPLLPASAFKDLEEYQQYLTTLNQSNPELAKQYFSLLSNPLPLNFVEEPMHTQEWSGEAGDDDDYNENKYNHHYDENQKDNDSEGEDEEVFPDLPSENDIVDEDLVIDEFKSSSSSEEGSLKKMKSIGNRSIRHKSASNKKAIRSINGGGNPAGVGAVAGSSKPLSETSSEDEGDNNSEWDESISSQDISQRKQRSADYMFQPNSESIQDMKEGSLTVSQHKNQSAQKSNRNSRSKHKSGQMSSDEKSSKRTSKLKESGYAVRTSQERTDEFDLDSEEMKNLQEIRDIEKMYSKNQQIQGSQAGQRSSMSHSGHKSTPHGSSVAGAARTPLGNFQFSQSGTGKSKQKRAISPETAAILIQKVWKGFQIRRILRFHQQMYEDEQYIGTGELSGYDEDDLTEEQEDQLLRQQIMEYLYENNEEWTEQEFEDYFLKFKAKHAQEKQQYKLAKQAAATSAAAADYEQSEDGLLHTEDLLMDEDLYMKSAQRYQQMREKQSQLINDPMQINYDELMRMDPSKASNPHSQRGGVSDKKKMKEQQNQTLNKPKEDIVNLDSEKNITGEEEYRDDFSDNIPNDGAHEDYDDLNSGSDQVNKDHEDQDLLNFLKKGVQMFGEKQSGNKQAQNRVCIEDENGEMVELDFSNLPGMETKHFKESMSGGSRFYDSQDEAGENLDSERNANGSLGEQQRREKEFNQVQQVSMKRKVNLGILVNDDDFNVYALGNAAAMKQQKLEDQRGFVAAPFRDAKPAPAASATHHAQEVPKERIEASESAPKAGEKVVHYNNYMENLEFSSKNSPVHQSNDELALNTEKDEINQGQDVLGGSMVVQDQNEGRYQEVEDEEEEEEVEEFEIDLDHLLTKSQYEDEEGNVFIYEQGQQIFLGEEELQMIEDYARQKMIEQKQLQQQHERDQMVEERSSAEEDVETPIQGGATPSETDSAHPQQKEDSLTSISTTQQRRLNQDETNIVHTQQTNTNKINKNQGDKCQEPSNNQLQKLPADLPLNESQQPQTLSQVSQSSSKNNLNSSQISEISRAKKEQAKQWSDLMHMLEDYDASNHQQIIEQIKMKSQQNYNQLNSEIINKSQQSGTSTNRSNKNQSAQQKKEIKYPEVSVVAAEEETNSYQLDESVAGEQSLGESAIGKRMHSHEDELTSASQILQHHWRRSGGAAAVAPGGRGSGASQGHQHLHSPNLYQDDDEGSSTGGSVFESAPFQDFAQKKYKEFLQQSSQQKLEQSINDEDENNSIQFNHISQSTDKNQNQQVRGRQRRHSDEGISSNSSPYGRMHLSSPNGTLPANSPRSYDTKQVDSQNQKQLSQQQLQQQQQLINNQHNMMASSSSSTSSIVRTQRDIIFIQKIKAMNQEQQASGFMNNNSGQQGSLRQNLSLSSGPLISSPLQLAESQSCRNQQQTQKYSQFLASGEQSLSQSSFTRLAQSSFLCASQGEVKSSNFEERAQQQRNNIVVIDSYKPIELAKRKTIDSSKNNEDLAGAAPPPVGSPSPWAATAGPMEDVESVTSEEENMENSLEQEELLNKKLQAMNLLEPAAFNDDLEDLERDRRDFEETYKNLESTEKKSSVTTKTNSNGEKQYYLEENFPGAQGTFFAQEDLLQETPKDDDYENGDPTELEDSQECAAGAGARPFDNLQSETASHQKYNVDINQLSENKSVDATGWNSATSSQILPATPAQFLKQRYSTQQQQQHNYGNAAAGSDATVTPSNGVHNHNLSSINWDKEMMLSGCTTSEKKHPQRLEQLQEQQKQHQQHPSIMHLLTQQVDTPIEKCHLTNQYSQHHQQRDSHTPNLAEEPSVSNLYSNYHNNYSLSDEKGRADAASANSVATPGGSIAQQIYLNNLIHAQHGKQIPRSADKLSDFNYSPSKLGDDDYSLDEGLYDSVNQATPMQLRGSQVNDDLLVVNNSDMKYDSEVFENESVASAAPVAIDGLQQSHLQNNRGTNGIVVTVDDCISEESDSNEPVSMNQGRVLPNHDSIQDEMPSIHSTGQSSSVIHSEQIPEKNRRDLSEGSNDRSPAVAVDTIADNILKSLLQEFSQELLSKPEMSERFRSIHSGKSTREEISHRHLQVGPQHDDYYDEFEGEEEEEDEEGQVYEHEEEDSRVQSENRQNQSPSDGKNNQQRNHLHSVQSPQHSRDNSNQKYRRRMQGIATEMAAVRNYLSRLCDYILETYADSFVDRINLSLGPSAMEMLRFLHFSDGNQSVDGSQQQQSETAGAGSSSLDTSTSELSMQHQAVLTTDLYSAFEMLLLEEKAVSVGVVANQNAEELSQFRITSKDITHIHNKVIFDALNEALDSHRIYGLKGRPFPWRVDATKIYNAPILRERIPEILLNSQKRVLEWARCKCGVIFDKQDHGYSYYNLTEEYITQTKERHLTAMLHSEVKEAEEKWIIYDDEYTEIQVEIAEYVFEELVTQAARDLADLHHHPQQIS